MDTIVFDCPRCRTARSTFDVDYQGVIPRNSNSGTLLGRCRSCQHGVVFDLERNYGQTSGANPIIVFSGSPWRPTAVFPSPRKVEVSDFIPEPVRFAMQEAEHTLAVASARVARGQFRIVLDVAAKYVVDENPSCVADRTFTHPLKLNDRINILAKHHLLTPALRDWAHGVRGITNEDVHTAESVTPAEAQEIAEITRMILTYLFEMPERVRLAKEAAEAKKQSTSDKLLAPPT